MDKLEEFKNDVEIYHHIASKAAINYVEAKAREILREHKELDEFVMAMGVYAFTAHPVKDDQDDSNFLGGQSGDWYLKDNTEWTKELDEFINEWDMFLHITGEPMRFTVDGEIVHNW